MPLLFQKIPRLEQLVTNFWNAAKFQATFLDTDFPRGREKKGRRLLNLAREVRASINVPLKRVPVEPRRERTIGDTEDDEGFNRGVHVCSQRSRLILSTRGIRTKFIPPRAESGFHFLPSIAHRRRSANLITGGENSLLKFVR